MPVGSLTRMGGRKGVPASRPIAPNSLKTTFAGVYAEAGVRSLSIQALRRTFTTMRRKRGVALELVAADPGRPDTAGVLPHR